MVSFKNRLKDALGLIEYGEGETWENRLQEAAYTPPSGVRITFDYADLSKEVNKKTSVFEFPDANGALVQDHGLGARRYPMLIFFWGADHDQKAEIFEAALSETGPGFLESPIYGALQVVPFGSFTRRDDLVSAANQTVFEVTFFSTVGTAYPIGEEDAASATMKAIDLFGSATDADFATSINQGSVSEEKGILDTINSNVKKIESKMKQIAAVQEVIKNEFDGYVDAINNIISVGVGDPVMLAFNTRQMIQAPGRAMANISDRLDGYSNLIQEIFDLPDSVSEPGGPGGLGPSINPVLGVGNDMQEPNKFHVRKMFMLNYLISMVLSVLYTMTKSGSAGAVSAINKIKSDAKKNNAAAGGNTFETSEQALETAEKLLYWLELLLNWIDSNYKSISGGDLSALEQLGFIMSPANVDPGSGIRYLVDAVSLASGYLIELSFTLKRQKTEALTRSRSVIDFVYEKYGNIDDGTLNEFINSNNLAGSKILELEKGQKINYYV